MSGAITSPPPKYVLMAWCLLKHRDSFAFRSTRINNEVVRPLEDVRQRIEKQALLDRCISGCYTPCGSGF